MNLNDWRCEPCKESNNQHNSNEGDKVGNQTALNGGEIIKELRILQWNCNGVHREKDLLEYYLHMFKVHLCCLQETKLIQSDNLPTINDFTTARKDRYYQGEVRGGGLITLIHRDLHCKIVDAEVKDDWGIEALSIVIPMANGTKTKITNMYISPESSPYFRNLGVTQPTIPIEMEEGDIICGDLNAHDDLWDVRVNPNNRGRDLIDALIDGNGTILNDGSATRQDPATGNTSTPDVTIVHTNEIEQYSWEALDILASDHKPILITIDRGTELAERKKRLVWNWRDANWCIFKHSIEQNLSEVSVAHRIKDMETKIRKSILHAARHHIGMKAVGLSDQYLINGDIKLLADQRDLSRKDDPAGINSLHFRELDHAVCEMSKQANKDILRRKVVEAKGTKNMWSLLKSLNGKAALNGTNKALAHDGKEYYTNKQKANLFRSSYQKISKLKIDKGDRWVKAKVNTELRKITDEQEVCCDITIDEVTAAIEAINPNKSPDPDDIHPKFLKNIGPFAISAISTLLNNVWSNGVVPQSWREADITPILH